MLYRLLLRPFFFLFEAERAHQLAMRLFTAISYLPLAPQLIRLMFNSRANDLAVDVFGLRFKNPVGLAAGFDKDGRYLRALAMLGFGYIEVGTVTPKPQAGNPPPRLFRLKKSEAIINRMGFNNAGVDALAERLKGWHAEDVIIGANIGKNKATPNDRAIDDYLICLDKLHPYVDYFVVNVSSPNTPDLRELQEKKPLSDLLGAVMERMVTYPKRRPVLLKIAPDLSDGRLPDIVEIVRAVGVAGIIATNTTIGRAGLNESREQVKKIGPGGLSGKPLAGRSQEVLVTLTGLAPEIPLISVGGISTGTEARQRLESGAKLVQIYTSFMYGGPKTVKRILGSLAR